MLTAHRSRVPTHVLMRVRLAPRSECTGARPSPASPTVPFRTCVDQREREREWGGASRAFELLRCKVLGEQFQFRLSNRRVHILFSIEIYFNTYGLKSDNAPVSR